MPCLSGRFDPAVGPIINIAVLTPGSWTPSGLTIPGVVLFPALMEFAAPTASPYQVLLGRDIICRGALSVSFDGHFTFSL